MIEVGEIQMKYLNGIVICSGFGVLLIKFSTFTEQGHFSSKPHRCPHFAPTMTEDEELLQLL